MSFLLFVYPSELLLLYPIIFLPASLYLTANLVLYVVSQLFVMITFLFPGNVAYDPVSSRLILTTDSANGEATNSSEPLIPYVPYPINPHTGQPVECHLSPLDKRGDMRLNGSMSDPTKGLPVPILGMTIHPVTGKAKSFALQSNTSFKGAFVM